MGWSGAGRGRGAAYDEPFAWWGPVWEAPRRRSIVELIADAVMPAEWAAWLWAMLARRASVLVVAGPRGAGKTTVLTALLDCYPAATRRFYLRGCYEGFGLLTDPAVEPRRSLLLINEISAHLPVYLWGEGVRRALAARSLGYAVAATAHAASVAELVALLTDHPLRVPPELVGMLDLVIVLDGERERERERERDGPAPRVASIWTLSPSTERPAAGIVTTKVADRGRSLDISAIGGAPLTVGDQAAVTVAEVRSRATWLRRLAERGEGRGVPLDELLAAWTMEGEVPAMSAGGGASPSPPSP